MQVARKTSSLVRFELGARRGKGAILVLGVTPPPNGDGLDFHAASTASEALEMLRVLRFDLIVIAPNLPDMSIWDLVVTIRHFWPWQRWVLVSDAAAASDHRQAAELGVTGVFEEMPPIEAMRRFARQT